MNCPGLLETGRLFRAFGAEPALAGERSGKMKSVQAKNGGSSVKGGEE